MSLDWLIGHTGFSFLDRWAVVHLCFWVFTGSVVWGLIRKHRWPWGRVLVLAGCLALAYGWEGLEAYLAPRHTTMWLDWFTYQGSTFLAVCPQYAEGCHYESWWNSYISDPLTCIAGVLGVWTMLDWGKP
jgi:hypothetical protein